MDLLLEGGNLASRLPGRLRVLSPLVHRVLRRATIATLPRWMREAIGTRQGPVVDALVTAVVRPARCWPPRCSTSSPSVPRP